LSMIAQKNGGQWDPWCPIWASWSSWHHVAKLPTSKLCGSLRSEINEHSCQMWWTWKACVCKSGWFWALQKKRIKLYLHQANDGLGDNLMDDTRIV
jgi:hypothetical protein